MSVQNERIALKLKILPFVDLTRYRSPMSRVENTVRVRFVNKTNTNVLLYWHGFNGDLQMYTELPPLEIENMTTYLGHIWSSIDQLTGDHLSVIDHINISCQNNNDDIEIDTDSQYYYEIKRNNNNQSTNINAEGSQGGQRGPSYEIYIKTPLLSLKKLCYKTIRDELVFKDNINLYDKISILPRQLFDELKIILIKSMTYANRTD